jgi:hypothetical protein
MMFEFIRRIELWLLFGVSTAFNLTIGGSDFGDISGQLTAAGLLVLLVVPKVKNENLVAAATLLGSGLRISLFVQLQHYGWMEHSTMQGATIFAIAVSSVFDGVGKHLAIKSAPQLITMTAVLSLVYFGMQLADGFNYAAGALLCVLPLSLKRNILDKDVAQIPAIISGFIIGWYVNEQSMFGVVNNHAFVLSVVLVSSVSFKQFAFSGPMLLFGTLLGHFYCQREQFIWLFSALVLWQIKLMLMPKQSDRL